MEAPLHVGSSKGSTLHTKSHQKIKTAVLGSKLTILKKSEFLPKFQPILTAQTLANKRVCKANQANKRAKGNQKIHLKAKETP